MYSVCLIGHGYWGQKLSRNFVNSEFFELVSIADKNKKSFTFINKNYPKVTCYENFKKAIDQEEVDLVIIATPTSTHYKIAKYALEKSKHILVEKPITLSLIETKKLNKIAKKNKKLIFVDYPFLFSGSINFLKEIIKKNKYGKILEIESFREQAPIRRDANVIWDLGAHDISILTYLLNKQPHSVKTIKRYSLGKSLCDCAYINLVYKNNLKVLIKNSWISPTKIRLIKIKLKHAIIYCDENESIHKIKIYKRKSKHIADKYNLIVPEIDLNEPLSKLVKYIYLSIKNNTNELFENKINEKITLLLEKIDNS